MARAPIVGLAFAVAILSMARTASAECVVRAELAGVVNGAVADHLEDALEAARDCAALLVVIDTPGGELTATRRIAGSFLASESPVITYVAPGGARAGSAGMFIALAGHVAAMAPATNIGAAHPVVLGGGDPEAAGGKHLGKKVESDAAAFARAIAERRGRSRDWVEGAVIDSDSATAEEALAAGVIDLIAPDVQALLAAIDGRRVELEGTDAVLATDGAELIDHPMTVSQKLRSVLGHPSFVYAMFLLGILGLMIELSSPGLIVPGVAGATALVLAVIGIDALPVSAAAIGLMVLGAGLLLAELYVVSFGLLTAGGVAALLLAAALLVDRSASDFFADPSLSVSWVAVIPLIAVVAAAAGLLAWKIARTQARRSSTGAEGLIGARGIAVTEIAASGRAQVAGERWEAASPMPIEAGEAIEVVAVEGLRLEVEPARERKVSQWTGP
jgi:membrane-bound serine protease (ClpP class)